MKIMQFQLFKELTKNWYEYPKNVRRKQLLYLLKPKTYFDVLRLTITRKAKYQLFDPFLCYDIIKTGMYGQTYSADIHVAPMIPCIKNNDDK